MMSEAKKPQVILCWDLDGVLNLYKPDEDEPSTICGQQVFVEARGGGSVLIPNIPLLNIVFGILRDHGIQSSLVSQRITYEGDAETASGSMREAMYTVVERALPGVFKQKDSENIAEQFKQKVQQKPKGTDGLFAENGKNDMLAAVQGESGARVILIDDCQTYIDEAKKVGFECVHFCPETIKEQPRYLAKVLLHVLPLGAVLAGIQKHAKCPDAKNIMLSAVLKEEFPTFCQTLVKLKYSKQSTKKIDGEFGTKIEQFFNKGWEKAKGEMRALWAVFPKVEMSPPSSAFRMFGESVSSSVSDQLISALTQYQEDENKKNLATLHTTLQSCYDSVEKAKISKLSIRI